MYNPYNSRNQLLTLKDIQTILITYKCSFNIKNLIQEKKKQTMSSGPKNFFATNLLQLQNHIKRDPTSYKDEVCLKF